MLAVQFILRIGRLLSKLPLYDLATLAVATVVVAASAAASAVAVVADVGLRTKRYLLSSLCFCCCCRRCCGSLENGCWRSCSRLLRRCKLSFAISACCPGEQLTVVPVVVLCTSSSCCCCCCCSPSQVVVVVLLSLCLSCCRSDAIFPLSHPRPCPTVVNCCPVVLSLALAAATVAAPISISTEAVVDAPWRASSGEDSAWDRQHLVVD